MTDAADPSPSCPCTPAAADRRAVLRFILLTLTLLVIDVGSKAAAFQWVGGEPVAWRDSPAETARHLSRIEPIVLLPRLLHVRLWLNEGAIFGIGQGQRWLFAVVSIAAVFIIWRVFARSGAGQRAFHLALAAVLAGAVGNLYDRLRFGAVRDMIHLFPEVYLPFGWTWPGTDQRGLYPWIFNFADMWLVGGVALLLILTWRSGSPRPSEAQTARD
jgi:signal peptidase II